MMLNELTLIMLILIMSPLMLGLLSLHISINSSGENAVQRLHNQHPQGNTVLSKSHNSKR